MRITLEFAHFVLGVLIVLPMAVLPFAGVSEVRARNGLGARWLGRSITVIGAGALFVGLLGILLISFVPNVTIVTPWIGISVILYGAAIALSMGVTAPRLRAASEALAAGQAASAGRILASGVVTAALLGVVVVLMVWKP